jgi:DNA-binding CsgD family transcriptional regulator
MRDCAAERDDSYRFEDETRCGEQERRVLRWFRGTPPGEAEYDLPVAPIVGREGELAVVEAFLAEDDPGARTLAIVGEPGIGKTTVWREAVRRAREQAAVVLVAAPAESEARLSFAGLTDLLSPVAPEGFGALPAPQQQALAVALLRAEAARPPERRLVGTALLSLLRELAKDGEVVIAIDDVQWLDPPSAGGIEFAARRLVDDPVRLILSLRSEQAEGSVLAGIARQGRVRRLELGPLSVASLHRIVGEQLGRSFPRPTLVRIAQASAGNPLYALEIARLVDRGEPGGPAALPVPEGLQALVTERVRSLPAETQAALLRAATLARPDLRLVDARALAPAEEAELVRIGSDGRVEFVHPLFASAVYSSASLSDRRETHRALAGGVADAEEVARHLALGCEGEDEEVAREVERAAHLARSRGAPDTAADLTELALRLVPEGSPSVDRLRLALARHLYFAGDFQRAGRLLEELRRDLEAGDLRAEVLLTQSDIDYWRRGESAAVALAEEALAAARDRLLRARCHAAIAMYAGTVDLQKAAAAARSALDLLEALPDADPGLVAAALGARVRADLFLGAGYDAGAAERALELERGSLPAAVDTRVVFKLGQWLRYVDDFDGARRHLAEAEQATLDEGDESSLANILLNRVVLECWAGEWEEADDLAGRMMDAFEQLGVETDGVNPWRTYVDAHFGRLEAVRVAAVRARPEEPIVAMIWDRCLGLAELAAGESEAADRHLSAALAELDRVDFREPAVWRVDGDAIEAAVAVGDLDRAESLVARLEERAARSRIPWSLAVAARCRALVLAAGGEPEPAAEALERALVEHERCPVPFERARTLLLQGQVLRRLKRKRQARAALEEALGTFRRLGAAPWVARTEAELGRVAVRRAPDDLSATELRIAALAAAGLTNRAIAAEVFVTQKTVEANLARVYRKLGIRSRAQLSRALDARESRTADPDAGP